MPLQQDQALHTIEANVGDEIPLTPESRDILQKMLQGLEQSGYVIASQQELSTGNDNIRTLINFYDYVQNTFGRRNHIEISFIDRVSEQLQNRHGIAVSSSILENAMLNVIEDGIFPQYRISPERVERAAIDFAEDRGSVPI